MNGLDVYKDQLDELETELRQEVSRRILDPYNGMTEGGFSLCVDVPHDIDDDLADRLINAIAKIVGGIRPGSWSMSIRLDRGYKEIRCEVEP